MQFTTMIFFLLGLVPLAAARPSELIAESFNAALVSAGDHEKYAIHSDMILTPAIVAALKEMNAKLYNITGHNETRAPMERNKSDIFCADRIGAYGWSWALTSYIWEIIRKVQGQGRVCPINGRQCLAFGVGYKSLLVLCNDNPFFIQPDCGYLASYASDIISRCNDQLHYGDSKIIGQRFDTDQYNVIVRGIISS